MSLNRLFRNFPSRGRKNMGGKDSTEIRAAEITQTVKGGVEEVELADLTEEERRQLQGVLVDLSKSALKNFRSSICGTDTEYDGTEVSSVQVNFGRYGYPDISATVYRDYFFHSAENTVGLVLGFKENGGSMWVKVGLKLRRESFFLGGRNEDWDIGN